MCKIDLQFGDCLEVMQSMPDHSVDCIICDLPYGTTACKWDSIIDMQLLWESYNRIIVSNGPIILFGSEPFSSMVRISNINDYKYDWVWNKKLAGNGILAKKQPLKIHENIMVFHTTIYFPQKTKGKFRRKMTGGMNTNSVDTLHNSSSIVDEYNTDQYYPTSIQEFSVANLRGDKRLHPTQKPVELLEYLIQTYTLEGETVLDNCMGSGTTGIACKHLNRNFIGIEKDSEYFEIAKNRINNNDFNLTRSINHNFPKQLNLFS